MKKTRAKPQGPRTPRKQRARISRVTIRSARLPLLALFALILIVRALGLAQARQSRGHVSGAVAGQSRSQLAAPMAAMKSDLKKLASQQEIYYADGEPPGYPVTPRAPGMITCTR